MKEGKPRANVNEKNTKQNIHTDTTHAIDITQRWRQGLVFHQSGKVRTLDARIAWACKVAKNFIGFAQHFAACRALIWINGIHIYSPSCVLHSVRFGYFIWIFSKNPLCFACERNAEGRSEFKKKTIDCYCRQPPLNRIDDLLRAHIFNAWE